MKPDTDFAPFFDFALPTIWQNKLRKQIPKTLDKNGNFKKWLVNFKNLPKIKTPNIDFNRAMPKFGNQNEIDEATFTKLQESLRGFHPWRKGPFSVFGIKIDTEWQSNLKWQRLQDHIKPLAGRRVLDVGCGNGYHILRMLGEGAAQVTGIDPNLLFILQFESLLNLAEKRPNACILPISFEAVPPNLQVYDSVFSMGVLYHRKSPFNHLTALKEVLKPGGELILETLVVNGEEGYSLLPKDRYAKMRNVWQIPSVATLETWLERSGFKNIKTVSVSSTGKCEQRKTKWMEFESLADFLDPLDSTLTIEGYPAPKRAICIAEK